MVSFIFDYLKHYIILRNSDDRLIAISPFGHSDSTLDGLFIYGGLNEKRYYTDDGGHLKIIGVDIV